MASPCSLVRAAGVAPPYRGGRAGFTPPHRLSVFLLDLVRDVLRDGLVMVELHRELRTARGHRAQGVDVAEHVGERHEGVDHVGIATRILALNHAPTRGQVADDAAGIFFRRHDFDLHDRLEQLGASLAQTFTHTHPRCDFEGKNARVDIVELAVDERHLEVDHGEAGKRTGVHDRLDALFDARDVFLRNGTTNDARFKRIPFARLSWRDDQLDLCELTRPTRLFLVGVGVLRLVTDGLAIGHLRRTDVGLDLELTLHAIHEDVEVKFAHALHDGLAALEVGLDAEGRILGRQTSEGDAHLLLVGFGLGLDGDLDHRIWEGHRFENDRALFRAQRVAGGGVLQTGKRDDVAGESLFDLFAVDGVHHHHPANALFLALGRVEHRVALFQDARVDARKGQRADEGVVHDLERQRRERL